MIHKPRDMRGQLRKCDTAAVHFLVPSASKQLHSNSQPTPDIMSSNASLTATTSPQSDCLLFKLPAELRNKIYELALHVQSSTEAAIITRRPRNPKSPTVLGLLQTCKQINSEAAGIFYSTNELMLHTDDDGPRSTRTFVQALSGKRRESITRIHIRSARQTTECISFALEWVRRLPRIESLVLDMPLGGSRERSLPAALLDARSTLQGAVSAMPTLKEIEVTDCGRPLRRKALQAYFESMLDGKGDCEWEERLSDMHKARWCVMPRWSLKAPGPRLL